LQGSASHECAQYTAKKENQILLIYKEIQNGAVAALVFTTLVTLKIMEKYQKISLKFNFSMKKIWGKHRCGTMPFISALQNV
jgi:hypothetical protein